MNKIRENTVDGVKLLQIIAQKDVDMKAASDAFTLFVSYFEDKIKVFAEQHAIKLAFNEQVAFEAVQCAFNKVWLYPTFDMNKSRCKTEESAVITWLESIAVSQMYQFSKMGVCAQIKEEEDLSIIESSEDFVDNFQIADLDPEQKLKYITFFNKKMSSLSEKHRIIYLTYKAYQTRGKKLPRKLLQKLRQRLGLTQVSIRVYKREACILLGDSTLIDP